MEDEDLKNILKNLIKIKNKLEKDDDCDIPKIAQASIKIEHKKFELANIFKSIENGKNIYLHIINIARCEEINLYNYFLQILVHDRNPEKIIKELEKAQQNLLEVLLELGKELTQLELKKFKEDKE